MAAPSVTYTFANGAASDATQVNQNFTDIINGITDGTKDLSINALTLAGAFTANGTVAIGNASSDDLTITASLASSIPIKTNNTYDIGAATLGLRALYMASSSAAFCAKVQGPAISAAVTLTLPDYTGTVRNIPTIVSKTTTYPLVASDELVLADTSGGAWTATLPTAAGRTGKVYAFKKTTSDVAALTIATTSAQTIDGSTTTSVNTQYEYLEVISDGSNWHIQRRYIPSIWTAYTPTISGLGTVSAVDFQWRRVGQDIEVRGTHTNGTTAASAVSFTLPLSLQVSSDLSANTKLIGSMVSSSTTANNYKDFDIIANSSSGNVVNVSTVEYTAAISALTGQNGNAIISDSLVVASSFKVQVSGWKG